MQYTAESSLDGPTRLVDDMHDSFCLLDEFEKIDDEEIRPKTELVNIQNRESNRLVEKALMENWMDKDN